MKIRFLSKNTHKIKEVQEILQHTGVKIVPLKESIQEIQTPSIEEIVKDKCLKAFQKVGQPVLVEHTGLYINSMNRLPGGLTQVFWDTLEADKFAEFFGGNKDNTVEAKTVIGFCDNKKVHLFEGSIKGKIPIKPKGNRDFQWDCVFIPDGYEQTFAEMGEQKNQISMRRKAFDNFAKYIRTIVK